MGRGGLVVAAVLALVACDAREGNVELNPNYREPMINGYVYKTEYYDGTIDYDKDVEVVDIEGLRMVPVVTMNDAPLEIYYYGATAFRYGDPYYNPVAQKYELVVQHYWGEAFSRVVLPGDFGVTLPRFRSIQHRESTLVAAWRPSFAAQWYWVSLYCAYDYYDSLGEWADYEFSLDTLVFDTTLAVGPERIFPPFVDSLNEGDGSAMVWAGNGPAIEPGDMGNVRGSGYGFFNAINEPREAYFYVGAPPLVRRAPPERAQRDRMRARLQQRNAGR